jgi:rfaE bifunctional protein nucleotidyltransferase chain/domain
MQAPTFLSKIAVAADAKARIAALPRPVVFTNGVFDVIHAGHVAYLDQARQLGASLVVAVNTDASVKRLNKGDERPLNPLDDRMVVLAAMAAVDLVLPFDQDTPYELITATLPDILVKGGDYDVNTAVGAQEVIANGGQFHAIPFIYPRSTTALVRRIVAAHTSDKK